MKKYLNLLVAVICGILLICGCDSNNDSVASDSDLEQSAGPYVCVKEIRHNYVDDQVLSYGIRFAYDESGKEIMTYGYTIENGLEIPKDFTDDYQYDEKGNMIHFVLKKISSESDFSRETDIEYEYDESGRMIYSKPYEHDADGIQTYSEYSYDESGNLCQEIRYDQWNNKQYAYSNAEDFEYDEYGNVTKQTVHFTVDPDSAYEGESYYDYTVIEYQYMPLSVYLESKSSDLSGLWYDMYRVHTQYEISENTISYSDSSLDHREFTYEIIDDTHIRLSENGADSQVFPYFYYTENDENFLVIGGIDSLYGVCTLKQPHGDTPETVIPDDKDGEAAVIASETIERFWRYYTYYECCDIEILGYGAEFMESPDFELLSSEQKANFVIWIGAERMLRKAYAVAARRKVMLRSIGIYRNP